MFALFFLRSIFVTRKQSSFLRLIIAGSNKEDILLRLRVASLANNPIFFADRIKRSGVRRPFTRGNPAVS